MLQFVAQHDPVAPIVRRVLPGVGDDKPEFGPLENVAPLCRRHPGVDADGDPACMDRAEKGADPRHAVIQRNRDPVAGCNTALREYGCGASDPIAQFAVIEMDVSAHKRHTIGVVRCEQGLRGIQFHRKNPNRRLEIDVVSSILVT